MVTRRADGSRKTESREHFGRLRGRAKEPRAGNLAAHEVELKFVVPERARAALVSALDSPPYQARHLTSRYFDTPDGHLGAAGISLRLRQIDQDWVQTLKISAGGNIQDRLEDEVSVSRSADGSLPALDLTRHDRKPAGAALKRLLKSENGQQLVERYSTDVVRRSCELKGGQSRVEVAFDQGRVVTGEREAPVCELEFELKAGDAKDLCDIARAWVERYALWLSTESKSARGERLVAACEDLPVVKATHPKLDAEISGPVLLQAVVRSCLDQVLPNATAVAAGSLDNEHVHQLRVGLRRLRTAMRELGDLSDQLNPEWEAPLADVFRQLGAYRDRKAVLEALGPKLLEAGASGVDWMKTEGDQADSVAAVRDARFQTALLHVLGFALGEHPGGDGAGDASPVMKRFRRRLNSLHRSVVSDGLRFRRLNEPAQHRVRKRLKRLRYFSEFVGALYDEKALESYLDSLHPAQDALGEHNDYAVARDMARAAADRGDPDAVFALRWLDKQQEKSAKASKRALKVIDDAPRYWKKELSFH